MYQLAVRCCRPFPDHRCPVSSCDLWMSSTINVSCSQNNTKVKPRRPSLSPPVLVSRTMSQSQAHIAGIGISPGTQHDFSNIAVSAGAKALLDAGITYAKIGLSVACSLDEARLKIPQACFKAFGRQKAPVCVVDSQSALFTAVQCVRSGQIDCAMVVGLDMVSDGRLLVFAIADLASRNQ
jgi:3-oxoacyl-[acyl-carrier-protein] synthase III